MKCDFFSRLPHKLRSSLHPHQPFHLDLSKSTSLTKGEREYYQKQLATLRSFEEVDSSEPSHVMEDGRVHGEQVQNEWAINVSNWSNILLLAFKVVATVKSGSVSAGTVLWFTHMSMKSTNIYKYPIGKLRLQPVGIIIFAAIMATLGFQMLIEAVEELIKGTPSEKMNSDQMVWLTVIMLIATGDHFVDVITNGVGLAAAVLGDRFYWWIDPTGAIMLAVYIISNWARTVLQNAVSLIGQAAPPEMLQKLTYLVLRYHSQIKRIDTVRAYTFGFLFFVEADKELPEDLPLKEGHEIGESLQIRIERLPEVERAFVHLDTECDHKPDHFSYDTSLLPRLTLFNEAN